MDVSNAKRVSREDLENPTETSVVEAKGRELSKLSEDLLGEIFYFLPRTELFGVRAVSKEWKLAVMGRRLWGKVEVYQDWNQKGMARNMTRNAFLSRVLEYVKSSPSHPPPSFQVALRHATSWKTRCTK